MANWTDDTCGNCGFSTKGKGYTLGKLTCETCGVIGCMVCGPPQAMPHPNMCRTCLDQARIRAISARHGQ